MRHHADESSIVVLAMLLTRKVKGKSVDALATNRWNPALPQSGAGMNLTIGTACIAV